MSSIIVIVSYGLGWPSEMNNIVKAAIPFYVSDMCVVHLYEMSAFFHFLPFSRSCKTIGFGSHFGSFSEKNFYFP